MHFIWIGLILFVQLPNLLEAAACHGHQFSCKDGECVASEQRCDHMRDCMDGSDEVDCDYACTSPHMKPCRDGHCIAMYFFCDNENHCGDWSDEHNCTGTLSGSSSVCPQNTFFWQNQVCIPQNWVCDGMDDCSDGKDEFHCNKTVVCKSGFQCGKECILSQWMCDGVTDCADGSDEKECGPDAFMDHSCLPEHGWFSCKNKGSQKCMPISRACDGYDDCDDRADEGGQCNWSTNCPKNNTCPNECHKTPSGPVCSCRTGLKINGSVCVDIDECSISHPLCSQKCSNNDGGFDCSCTTGYKLNTRDKRTYCIANGPELTLFITTDRDIRFISVPSKEYGLIQSGISQAHGVAGDYEDGFVYWNEKSKDKAGIYKSMLDGTAYQYVISVGVEMVEDLAIDWVGSHIYFVDSGRKHIVVCDLHGTICTVVISDQLDKPRAVAVHPEERLLFWSDWGSNPHIESSGMDGSKRFNIITTDIVWPNGLTVDETIQRIFWGDAKLNRIESSRLDGSDRQVLSVQVNHPYALDVFEDTVYWCDPIEHEVLSANKFSGKDRKVLIKEASLTPTGIHAHHPSKQNHIHNPCRMVICSHLCLLAPNPGGFKCACPTGMTLNKDNRTCDQSTSQQSPTTTRAPSKTTTDVNLTVPCSSKFFRCLPDMTCHPRKAVCRGKKQCKQFSEDELCAILNESADSTSGPHSKRISSSVVSSAEFNLKPYISSAVEAPRKPLAIIFDDSKRKNCSLRIEFNREEEPSISNDDLSELETTLKAILDGPVHVLSRLFTKKGHHIDHVIVFDKDNQPVPINPVWDSANKTLFVEDIQVADDHELYYTVLNRKTFSLT